MTYEPKPNVPEPVRSYMREIGRKGGSSKSASKTEAARAGGKALQDRNRLARRVLERLEKLEVIAQDQPKGCAP